MKRPLLTQRVADLSSFRNVTARGIDLPLWPQVLAHVYIKLEFKSKFENATTIDDARCFLRSVSRASLAAGQIADRHAGFLLEVQGSVLHVGLTGYDAEELRERTFTFASELHWAYRELFPDASKRVQGWRLSADVGKTLIVVGRGVHHDDSYVSLGDAANRPAKHLYAQLAMSNEEDRELKRYHMGARDRSGRWNHVLLDTVPKPLNEAALQSLVKHSQDREPTVEFLRLENGDPKVVTARALPISPAGTPAAPSPDQPSAYFGWVMRADLDGFSKRIEECGSDDASLEQLGKEFYGLMETATHFVKQHPETLAQLPWAGDNFTAMAVFPTISAYRKAAPTRLVELTLDFEREFSGLSVACGFGGWAHAVAGGEPHGNAMGNVFLAGIEPDDRRFLVAVGEGVGRSAEAITDIKVPAGEVVAFEHDWNRLDASYQDCFKRATNTRGLQSSLYRVAKTDDLRDSRLERQSVAATITVTDNDRQRRSVEVKPYSR